MPRNNSINVGDIRDRLILEAEKEGVILYHVKATNIVSAIISQIIEELKEGKELKIRKLGTLCYKKSNKTRGRNVKTGETVTIKPRKLLRFKASKDTIIEEV